MRGVNKVILVGTVGKDPEVKYLPNGGQIANLSLATSETWTDKNTNQKQEKTEWHRVSIFGKLAEIAGQYVTKGSKLYIEGKLQTRKWQDQSGQDRYTTEVIVDGFSGTMQMLSGKPDSSQQPQQQPYQQPVAQPSPMAANPNGQQYVQKQAQNYQQQYANQNTMVAPSAQQSPHGFNDFNNDIPF